MHRLDTGDLTAAHPGVTPGPFADVTARILSRAAANATALAASTREHSAMRRALAEDARQRQSSSPYHSLAESLAIGLGCDSFGRRWSDPHGT